jgi:hypothetical protein
MANFLMFHAIVRTVMDFVDFSCCSSIQGFKEVSRLPMYIQRYASRTPKPVFKMVKQCSSMTLSSSDTIHIQKPQFR